MSLYLTDEDFISSFISRLKFIEIEIPSEESKNEKKRRFNFYFAQYIFGGLLGWTQIAGYGHYVINGKYDIALYDNMNTLVIIVRTKNPDDSLAEDDEIRLRHCIKESPARYGVLTNLHHLLFYEHEIATGWNIIANINTERIIQKGNSRLSLQEKSQILELRRMEKRQFLLLGNNRDKRVDNIFTNLMGLTRYFRSLSESHGH